MLNRRRRRRAAKKTGKIAESWGKVAQALANYVGNGI